MLRAQASQMNFISNDEVLALNIRVWDEKRNQLVDLEQIMDRLDRSRATVNAPAAPNGAGPSAIAPRPVSANTQSRSRS